MDATTPRTDAVAFVGDAGYLDPSKEEWEKMYEHACDLEREAAALRDQLAEMTTQRNSYKINATVYKERAERLEREKTALQAKIDRLMLEYCPEEITEEQMKTWEKYQKSVSPELESKIDAAKEQK